MDEVCYDVREVCDVCCDFREACDICNDVREVADVGYNVWCLRRCKSSLSYSIVVIVRKVCDGCHDVGELQWSSTMNKGIFLCTPT